MKEKLPLSSNWRRLPAGPRRDLQSSAPVSHGVFRPYALLVGVALVGAVYHFREPIVAELHQAMERLHTAIAHMQRR